MTDLKLQQQLNEIKTLVTKNYLSNKKVLNFKEFLEYTGFSESTGYKLTHNQKIPFHKPTNGSLFFFVDEIHEWIKNNKIYTEEEAIQILKTKKA